MRLENHAAYEQALAAQLGRLNRQQLRQVKDTLGESPRLDALGYTFWQAMADGLAGVLQPALEAIYVQQAAQLMGLSQAKGLGIGWEIVNERAAEWARDYVGLLVKGINETTRAAIQQQVEGFFRDQRTLDDLSASLTRLFGPQRAEMIAVTEVTRAAVQGELGFAAELNRLGLKTTFIWQTANDEIAGDCPICGPNHGKKQGDGWTDPPPGHPRCRCWINTVVERG